MDNLLFSPLHLGGIQVSNRIVSLPLYLAYPGEEQRPAFCGRWSRERRERFLERVGG